MLNGMEIRPFRLTDREPCLAVFDSIAPEGPDSARAEYESYLDAHGSSYYVVEHEGAVVGCGGFRVEPKDSSARLEWAMVRKDLQRQGLGRYLLMYRLKEIAKVPGVLFVEARVPDRLSNFYDKNGLKLQGSAPLDGFTDHRMKLQVCSAG